MGLSKWLLGCLVFALIWTNICFAAKNYCRRELCTDSKHIACDNTGRLAAKCGKNANLLPMNSKRKQLILHLHNSKRNDISLGKINGFPQAQRMAVLKWDKELAALAEFNVKQCEMLHDECRNTEKYHHAGQNIGIRKTSPDFPAHAKNLRHIVDRWFEEYKDCNRTFIESYQKHPNKKKKIGHFTAMVNDRAARVGCAVMLYESGPQRMKTFLMTCNYSSTNFRKRPVYSSGPSGSKCATGKSPQYNGLCSANENISPNPI